MRYLFISDHSVTKNCRSVRKRLAYFRYRHVILHILITDQMAEWYGASASESVDLGFDSESGQTNDFKIGIFTASLLDVQHLRDSVEKAGKFYLLCRWERH